MISAHSGAALPEGLVCNSHKVNFRAFIHAGLLLRNSRDGFTQLWLRARGQWHHCPPCLLLLPGLAGVCSIPALWQHFLLAGGRQGLVLQPQHLAKIKTVPNSWISGSWAGHALSRDRQSLSLVTYTGLYRFLTVKYNYWDSSS